MMWWMVLSFVVLSVSGQGNSELPYPLTCSSATCSNNGRCTVQGLCVCDTWYSGLRCDNEVEKKISFEAEGMSDGSFAGMIVAWVIGFPIVLALIAVPVYLKLVRAQ
ncbi:unnamed protein product [Vitrella brassicaformis CCMP3155]|uniref:EGF-like domain-containing protein n=2 Tax=Vitrella brassicaformis TaxID=1169539 RepID=A0A0G4EX55_VITBC|nr:unnamed protein product [Vitrella brassicaformis CCMP3155]|mmetsp:Transcript_47150/g.117636  ORF Transcript_47150/g.117636 Transcript_47150/m.117636 type:complete len:107 (+) Transcript_47150:316-636(+)|eukprot:CEM03256.1 unnamed protein product [Vitrella brassicaformis CCMP3155]